MVVCGVCVWTGHAAAFALLRARLLFPPRAPVGAVAGLRWGGGGEAAGAGAAGRAVREAARAPRRAAVRG